MLAVTSEPFNAKDFLFEPKMDGVRCIAYMDRKNRSVLLFNRQGIAITGRYPELHALWKTVRGDRVVLDGEIISLKNGRPDFYALMQRDKKTNSLQREILARRFPVIFSAFDILHKDGRDLVDLPLSERKAILETSVEETNRLVLLPGIVEKGVAFFDAVIEQGFEGVVAKRLQSTYVPYRSADWRKIKKLNTLDVAVIGYTPGRGKRAGTFGALLTAAFFRGEFVYTGKVGTGFTEAESSRLLGKMRRFRRKTPPIEIENISIDEPVTWIEPKLAIEVSCAEMTKDRHMRESRYLRTREKPVEGCIIP